MEIFNYSLKHLTLGLFRQYDVSAAAFHAGQAFESEDIIGIALICLAMIDWRRKWQPTPMFLPGESQGRGSLVGCRLWGRTESDMTEAT